MADCLQLLRFHIERSAEIPHPIEYQLAGGAHLVRFVPF